MSPEVELIINRVGWVLANFIWQGFAIAFLLRLFLFIYRSSSANVRYLAECVALVGLIAAPIITYAAVNVAPTAHTTSSVYRAGDRSAGRGLVKQTPALISAVMGKVQRVAQAVYIPIVLLWSGAIAGLLVLQLGACVLHRKLAAGPALPAELETVCRDLADSMGIRRVRFVRTDQLDTPATIGWFRPIVLVPPQLLTAEPLTFRGLMAHELAHIRRSDYLANLLQTIVASFLFFHPGVWTITRAIRREREEACDDIATELIGSTAYANALLFVEEARTPPAGTMAATGGKLVDRVRKILTNSSSTRPHFVGLAISASTFAAVLLVLAQAANSDELWMAAHASRPMAENELSILGAASDSTTFLVPLRAALAEKKPTLEQLSAIALEISTHGARIDALSNEAGPLESPCDLLAYQNSPAWHFGKPVDRVQLTERMFTHAKTVSTTDPLLSAQLARAALVIGCEEDYLRGLNYSVGLLAKPDFAQVAALSDRESRRLRMATIDGLVTFGDTWKGINSAERTVASGQASTLHDADLRTIISNVQDCGAVPGLQLRMLHLLWMLHATNPALADAQKPYLESLGYVERPSWIADVFQDDNRYKITPAITKPALHLATTQPSNTAGE